MKTTKIDKNSKHFKYYKGVKSGKSKKEAALVAGFALSTAKVPAMIEQTEQFRAIERHFKDEILAKTSLSNIADALIDNIEQKDMKVIDRGSRNRAIEIAMSRIEPNDMQEDSENVIIVLKQ